jgi:hypothetical protein
MCLDAIDICLDTIDMTRDTIDTSLDTTDTEPMLNSHEGRPAIENSTMPTASGIEDEGSGADFGNEKMMHILSTFNLSIEYQIQYMHTLPIERGEHSMPTPHRYLGDV